MVESKIKVQKVLKEYDNVKIFKVRDVEIPIYYLHTMELSTAEMRIKEGIKRKITKGILPDIGYSIASHEKKVQFMDNIQSLLEVFHDVPEANKEAIKKEIIKETIGYGRIDPLISDDNLEEIMVSGSKLPVFVIHREYGTCKTNITFDSDDELLALIHNICIRIGKEVNFKNPLLDAQMPGNIRLSIAVPPVALDGPSITIRKFMEDPLNMVDLIRSGTLSVELAAFLWMCADGLYLKPANILIGGGTASGKTTLLNSLLTFVPEGERVITIEDTEELHTPHLNRSRLETRSVGISEDGKGVTMDILMRKALRMRPDRVIVGEMRGSEARTLFVAMSSGHDGCMGTIHADTADEMLIRLTNPPLDVPKPMITGLDLMIMMRSVFIRKRGIQRRITEVKEVGYENEDLILTDIANWELEGDSINLSIENSKILKTIKESISSLDFDFNEIMNKRRELLQKLSETGTKTQELHNIVKRHRIQTMPLIKQK